MIRRRGRGLGVLRSPALAPLLEDAAPLRCEAHGAQLIAEWVHAHPEADRFDGQVFADAEQLCCMDGCVLRTAEVFGACLAVADADGALWLPRITSAGQDAQTTTPEDASVYSWGELPAPSTAGPATH